MMREKETFKEFANQLALQLAVKYKEAFPQIIFTTEELTDLFYKRIMTPPPERIPNKQ